jgi:hypothetical protein
MPCCACTGCGDAAATEDASTTAHATSHRKHDLFRDRMKISKMSRNGRTLEASRLRRVESNQVPVWDDALCPPTSITMGKASGLFHLPRRTFRNTLLSSGLFRPRLHCHHLIRPLNQYTQFAPRHRIQPVQHYPLVSSKVRCRTNVFALDQFCKTFGRALEA